MGLSAAQQGATVAAARQAADRLSQPADLKGVFLSLPHDSRGSDRRRRDAQFFDSLNIAGSRL